MGLILALVAAGGMGVYFYTSPPSSSGTSNGGASAQLNGVRVLTNQASGGYVVVQFNGTTYQAAEKGANSPTFPCPVGTDPGLCTLLRQTCGNGVGPAEEPWKNCVNCPFDVGCSGSQSCDPYTRTCTVRASACQVAVFGVA